MIVDESSVDNVKTLIVRKITGKIVEFFSIFCDSFFANIDSEMIQKSIGLFNFSRRILRACRGRRNAATGETAKQAGLPKRVNMPKRL